MGVATGTGHVRESEESDSDVCVHSPGSLAHTFKWPLCTTARLWGPLPCNKEKVRCVQGWGPTSPLSAMEQRTEGLL